MAVNPNQELVWQGRTQIGDEPGVFADAYFSGLCSELPITVYRIDPANTANVPFKLVLETENLETYPPYPGHSIVVTMLVPDPNPPYQATERVLVTSHFSSVDHNRKEIDVQPGPTSGPFFISVKLRSDTKVNPGFYDDFVWIRLSLISENSQYYASFGFRN